MPTVFPNTSYNAIANNIRKSKDFRNGTDSFSGRATSFTAWHTGWFSDANRQMMQDHGKTIGVDYVIFSYATPIAYRLSDGRWVVPVASYSTTSGRHQSHVWSILRALGIQTSWEWVPDISEKTGKPLKSRSHRERVIFDAYTSTLDEM